MPGELHRLLPIRIRCRKRLLIHRNSRGMRRNSPATALSPRVIPPRNRPIHRKRSRGIPHSRGMHHRVSRVIHLSNPRPTHRRRSRDIRRSRAMYHRVSPGIPLSSRPIHRRVSPGIHPLSRPIHPSRVGRIHAARAQPALIHRQMLEARTIPALGCPPIHVWPFLRVRRGPAVGAVHVPRIRRGDPLHLLLQLNPLLGAGMPGMLPMHAPQDAPPPPTMLRAPGDVLPGPSLADQQLEVSWAEGSVQGLEAGARQSPTSMIPVPSSA